MSDIYGQTFSFAFQSSAVANGNGSALNVGGLSTVLVDVAGLGTATINFEGIVGDSLVDWTPVFSTNIATGANAATANANGFYLVPMNGLAQLRCRISGYSAGTITVTGRGVANATTVPGSAGGGSVSQGTAAANTSSWPVKQVAEAISASTGVFDDVGVNPAIKNLASGALQVSGALDNRTTLDEYLDLLFKCKGASAFTAGATVSIWLLPALDGATYEDGSASITPARAPDALFFLRAVATAQVLELSGIQIPPTLFKILLRNDSNGGQAFTNVAADNTLVMYTHS